MPQILQLYIDGASRGNPGKSAFAFRAVLAGKTVMAFADLISEPTTNNVAEYYAARAALGYAIRKKFRHIALFTDSELVARQLNREYVVRAEHLKTLYRECAILLVQFDSHVIKWIPREDNTATDKLCNEALDAGQKIERANKYAQTPLPSL